MKNIGPILLIITCFAITKGHAVNPPPDGGYAGGNTAEGLGGLLGCVISRYN